MIWSCQNASKCLPLLSLSLSFKCLASRVKGLVPGQKAYVGPDRPLLLKPSFRIHPHTGTVVRISVLSSLLLSCSSCSAFSFLCVVISDQVVSLSPRWVTSCGNTPAHLTQLPLCFSYFISCSTVKNTTFTWCLQCYPAPTLSS